MHGGFVNFRQNVSINKNIFLSFEMSDRKKILLQLRSGISHQRKECIESETAKQLNMKSLA